MSGRQNEQASNRAKELELKLSELKFEFEEVKAQLHEEQEQRLFYQRIADFTFSWELWFHPNGKLNYCSPSCHDLTGYTANQVMMAPSLSELIVYNPDREKFDTFISGALDQMFVKPSLEFRILTRTRQMRWCSINVRGVYSRQGRYLGIRASVHDTTKLKRALGHINNLSEGREIESRNKQRLKSELEMKERDLITFLLQLSQKNELIATVTRQLKRLKEEAPNQKSERMQQLLKLLDKAAVTTIDWEMVEGQLEKLHPGYMDRLLQKHPRISSNDKKLCACLRLGLSSKEIAGLKNQSPQSVEVARVRLRRKLKVSHEERLANYLSEI